MWHLEIEKKWGNYSFATTDRQRVIQIQVQRWPAHHVTLASTAPPGAWRLSRLGLHRRCGRNKANACCINLRGSRRSGSLLLAPFILNSAALYRLIFTFLIIYMCVCVCVFICTYAHAWSRIIMHTESIWLHPLTFFVVAGAGSSSWCGLGGSRCHGLKLP